jgi:hypothetical protein
LKARYLCEYGKIKQKCGRTLKYKTSRWTKLGRNYFEVAEKLKKREYHTQKGKINKSFQSSGAQNSFYDFK